MLFCCQQAIEKRLKALVIRTTHSMPPRTHDLLRLAGVSHLELTEEREFFLRKLTNYYIATRYPEEVDEIAARVDGELAQRYLALTREAIIWLDSLVK